MSEALDDSLLACATAIRHNSIHSKSLREKVCHSLTTNETPQNAEGFRVFFRTVQNRANGYACLRSSSPLTAGALTYQQHIGQTLVTALFLRNRLTSCDTTGSFDWENAPPNNDLQALHINGDAQDKLREEIYDVFRKWIWVDFSRGPNLCMRVCEEAAMPPAEERLRPSFTNRYRPIESEGDGMRSYTATCMALLLSRRPLCLIDEPETCLHPPQAYRIGRFIGEHAGSAGNALFVATHSSHVLRGILDSRTDCRMIRLTRRERAFAAQTMDPNILRDSVAIPRVRAETVLDGIFADGVIVVEADGDRAVYEAAYDVASNGRGSDVLFTQVSGIDAAHGVVPLYRRLNIPVAVIADIDTVANPKKVGRILRSLSVDADIVQGLVGRCRGLADQIKRLPPTVTEDQFRTVLRELAELELDWAEDGNEKAYEAISQLRNRLDKMSRLKHGGVDAFRDVETIKAGIVEIIDATKGLGLFLVPVGQLEGWCRDLMTDGPSRETAQHGPTKQPSEFGEANDSDLDVCRFYRRSRRISLFHS